MTEPSKRILVCDDDPSILTFVEVNLELEGYEVYSASGGEEAVRIATSERPDLVILDVMMPRMDGYEACERLKQDDSTKDIPVIFLSARAQQADIERGQACGVSDYITKPFDPMELLEVVQRLVR
ncbi:MAG: response regulator transcription factor [Actinomycetota bacterium]